MVDVQKFYDLFVHRSDVFAEQQPSGAYLPQRRQLELEDIEEHLAGFASYGVYVVEPDLDTAGEHVYTVKYLVFDLDVLDEEASHMLCELVEQMVATAAIRHGGSERLPAYSVAKCLLREFSGNKGTHVWLFFEKPVEAAKVRRWVAADFMPAWREAAEANGWPVALEVFPKQDDVAPGGYGNLVKLPLGIHAVSGKRSQIVAHTGWANSVEEVQPLPVSLIPARDPVVTGGRTERAQQRSRGTGEGPASPFPCVDAIMREGVGRGHRDNAMFHLALYCYGHGLDEDLAQEVCERANDNFDPPLRPDEVRHKVRSAYSGRYESARCGTDWLADICPGPCQGGWRVRRDVDLSALAACQEGDTVEVAVVRVQQDGRTKRVTLGHPAARNNPTLVVG